MDREADIRFDFARRLGKGVFRALRRVGVIGDWGFQRRLRQTNPICAGRRAKRTQFVRGPAGPGNPKLEILNKSEMPMIETDPERKTKPIPARVCPVGSILPGVWRCGMVSRHVKPHKSALQKREKPR